MIIGSVYAGDIFATGMQTITCPTNCVGVMGKGLAKTTKERYPNVWRVYRRAFEEGGLHPHRPLIATAYPGRQVLCFHTKRHWRDASKVDDIEMGLRYLVDNYRVMYIDSIAIPAIGCGLGGLDWVTQVKPLICHYLDPIDLPVMLYEP